MFQHRRREFLKAAGVFGGVLRGLAHPTPESGLVELDLEVRQQWVETGNRKAYLYAFNGLIPGPPIEVRPGDHVRIRFRNALSEPANLHYHGLHVPPTECADNAFLHVPPGEELTYDFDISASHPGGTFWYHPHMHGLAAEQLSRGLAGVFVVRGELDQIPEIAASPATGRQGYLIGFEYAVVEGTSFVNEEE